jgi:NADPH2:quinone reductase
MALEDVATPSPGDGEVLIRNHAAGLNFFDILLIQGKYQVRPPFPFSPGREGAGIVEAVGAGVTGISAGDRVMADVETGSYAECSVADAAQVWPMPEGMSFAEASGFLVVYQTSYLALLLRAHLQPGEWLLVHAGASGVGMSAIQIGKAVRARIIATAGSQEKLDFCSQQGAEHVLNYRDETWVDRIKEITGGVGADVIYDPVGGDVFDLSTKCIAPQGRLVVVGFAGGRIPTIAANRILLKNMSVVGSYYGRYSKEHPEFFAETQRRLVQWYHEGKIRPAVTKTYPLDQAPQALADLAARRVAGKAALVIPA